MRHGRNLFLLVVALSVSVEAFSNISSNPLVAPYTQQSLYNDAIVNPGSDFFPAPPQAFPPTPPPSLSSDRNVDGMVVGSRGSPEEVQMWATSAIPAHNPFFNEQAYRAALRRQRELAMSEVNAKFTAQRFAVVQSNNACLFAQQQTALGGGGFPGVPGATGFGNIDLKSFSLESSLMSLFTTMNVVRANSAGVSLCGGATGGPGQSQFVQQPMFAGMSPIGSMGAAPYSSPQYQQLAIQNNMLQLQNRTVELEEERLALQREQFQHNRTLGLVNAGSDVLTRGMGTLGALASADANASLESLDRWENTYGETVRDINFNETPGGGHGSGIRNL